MMIIRKFWMHVCLQFIACAYVLLANAEDEDVVGIVRVKIENHTSRDDNDLYADKDLYTSSRPPPLMKQREREGPPLVNRSSSGILQIDADHKIGTCPPAYTIAIGSCLDTCKSDAECPGKWKCCKNDCGKSMCSSPIQDFGWYHWGQWGSCTASCGEGIRVRNRNCNFPGRLADQKKYCHGDHYELERCNTQQCDNYASPWMEWTSWTACSAKCGGGVRSRYRFRICADDDSNEKIFCDDFQMDLEECHYHSCADVVYSNWSGWSACSSTCGTGLMSRFRSCPFCPFIGYVGECSGPNYDYKVCTGPPCRGEVKEWSDWSRCTRDCDGGLKISVRKDSTCQSGQECEEFKFRSEICNPQKCPMISGDYGHWSDWSECSADGCEEGYQYASRDCNHPTPWNAGKYCSGKPFELRVCNVCKRVAGGWSDWEPWSDCSASCGGGLRYKSRKCNNPPPMYGGVFCPGEHFKLEACNTESCAVSEGYEWGCWSPCSRKCGGGGRIRYGACNAPTQQRYDQICNEDPYEDSDCNSEPCDDHEVESRLSAWNPWSPCSHTCGVGTRIRYKYSLCPVKDGAVSDACKGYDFEVERCQSKSCPKKSLAWDQWSNWSPCSSLCGGGSTIRVRKCLSHGVDQHLVCPGVPYDTQPCNTHPCDHYRQDYAAWSSWSLPTPCSGQCSDDGYFANTFRIFSCGAADGGDCPRLELRQVECDYRSCYKDVNNFIYPPWSEWSSCSRSCGTGYMHRNRTFSDDLPVNGEFCTRPAFEVAPCNREKCDVDGDWAAWSAWSECTAPCNGGMRARRRACTNPPPRGSGEYCVGDHFVSEQCNLQTCVKHEAEWSEWSRCSRHCGEGERVRFADCHDDEECCKKPYVVESCNTQKCEHDTSVTLQMLEWTEWTSCSKTCGCGVRLRYRFPDCSGFNVDIDHGECSGFEMDVERCGEGRCEDNGADETAALKSDLWGLWSEWSSCSVSCGGGIRQRERSCLADKMERCPGSNHGFDMCNTNFCPGIPLSRQQSGFGQWTQWTDCSVASGKGSRERARFKLLSETKEHEPDMELDTEDCTGSLPSVLRGSYSEWSQWSACTHTCGGGVQHRFRSVIGSSPCGSDCNDSLADTKSCGEKECIRMREVTELFGEWTSWSSCTRSCGGGIQTRRRQCMVVSVPEYIYAPKKKVTESVPVPLPRPVPRSACLNASSNHLSGIELAGCAISFCPGDLERFDAQYTAVDYSYPVQTSTSRYAGKDYSGYNSSTISPETGANRLKLDYLEEDDHEENQPKYPTAPTPSYPAVQYGSSNSSNHRPASPGYHPMLPDRPETNGLPPFQGWNPNTNSLYPNGSVLQPIQPPYQGYDFVNSTGHVLRYPHINPGVQTLVYNLPPQGDFRVQHPAEYGQRVNVSRPYLAPGPMPSQPAMQGWGTPQGEGMIFVGGNASRAQGSVMHYNQSIRYAGQTGAMPQQYGPGPVPPQGWGPIPMPPPQGWGVTSTYQSGYNQSARQTIYRAGLETEYRPSGASMPKPLGASYGGTQGWGPLTTFAGWSSTSPQGWGGTTSPIGWSSTTSPIGWSSTTSKPQGWGTTTTPQGWGTSSTFGYPPTSGWGVSAKGYGANKTEKSYSAPTPFQGWGSTPMLSTPPSPAGWSAAAVSKPYPNVSFALDLSKGFVGGWSEWGPWSGCTRSCNGGERFKIRVCAASSGRSECLGPDRRSDACNKQTCSATPTCVKQCKGDFDCGSNSRCCTPDNCNSVCIGGSDCNFDPQAPCTQATCRPGFECIAWSQPNCPYPPCEPVPKCICPLTCPSGYRKNPLTGETLCACNSACEAVNCKPRQRCVPLDRLCQSCPDVGLCLDEGCFLLQLYDKMMENGISSASSIYVIPPKMPAPVTGRNYSQMGQPGQNYTGRNAYIRGPPKPLPLAYSGPRPNETPKAPAPPSSPPAPPKVPSPRPDARTQGSHPGRSMNVPQADPVLMQRYRESVSADYDDYEEDAKKIPY